MEVLVVIIYFFSMHTSLDNILWEVCKWRWIIEFIVYINLIYLTKHLLISEPILILVALKLILSN